MSSTWVRRVSAHFLRVHPSFLPKPYLWVYEDCTHSRCTVCWHYVVERTGEFATATDTQVYDRGSFAIGRSHVEHSSVVAARPL